MWIGALASAGWLFSALRWVVYLHGAETTTIDGCEDDFRRCRRAVAGEELVDHDRLGDVFVMPNWELANRNTEGFELVLLEANGCGGAVVAGCAGVSWDAVRDVSGVCFGRAAGEIEGPIPGQARSPR